MTTLSERLKLKTANTRKNVALGVVKTLTPKFYQQIINADLVITHLPRPFTLMLKEYFSSNQLVGCEIGFSRGENATNILSTLNIKRLYCVEPYLDMRGYSDGSLRMAGHGDGRSNYPRLKHDNRVVFIEKTSDGHPFRKMRSLVPQS